MRSFRIIAICLLSLALAHAQGSYRKHGTVLLNHLETTPGATVSVSLEKLCAPGYTKTVRNVSAATKKQACDNYVVPADQCTGAYVEIDHLISLELGGSNDIANLWPQPYAPKPGAREKDRLENWLHKQVCAGEMSLADAQQVIANDWYAAYQRMLQATTAPSTLVAAIGTPAAIASTTQPPAAAAEEGPSTATPEGAAYDFAVTQEFLATLESGHTIQPQLSVKLGQHSGVHKLQDDCEMHIAGDVQNSTLGWPQSVVVEPPNVCKNAPSAAGASTGDWLGLFDSLAGSICQVSGFPRIFTEHASGSAGASNPNHVFEIHPATQINCGAHRQLNFGSLLKIYEGMRAIAPSTTAVCIHDRKLFVRYDGDRQQYVFREQEGRCGNFAIVEVQNVVKGTIRQIGGGHSAIARVSPDGQSITTLKLYTLAPSAIDMWMDQGGTSESRVLLHGLFTYDYFEMQRTLHPAGQDWQKPMEWTPIRFPLALVVFGDTQTVPWEE